MAKKIRRVLFHTHEDKTIKLDAVELLSVVYNQSAYCSDMSLFRKWLAESFSSGNKPEDDN